MENQSYSLLEIGKLLYSKQKTQQAIPVLQDAIKFAPESREAHIYLAYAFCRSGDYINGSREFNWVWREQFGDQTGLLGSINELNGKTVLISADAGLGDTIMFSRLLTFWNNRPCKVILQVQQPLVRLLQQSNLADKVIGFEENVPKHDLRIPMHNLMSSLNIADCFPLKNAPAYLKCNEDEVHNFQKMLPQDNTKKIGICWQGNPNFSDDYLRSVSLEYIQSLTSQQDHLVSLVPDAEIKSERFIQKFAFHDIAETAALVKSLDSVITVDTMICHLCGALGIPTILLNRFNGCWRWGENLGKSSWYDSVSIHRLPKK
jgi:tetratricopeptide (TPR) repeat protein